MMRIGSARLRSGVSALLVLALMLLAGCGGSDGSNKTNGQAARKPNMAAACDADTAVSDAINGIVITTPELQTEEFDVAAVKKVLPKVQAEYDKSVAPALADLVVAAPDEIRPEIESGAAKFKEFRETGNIKVLPFGVEKVGKFFFANCPGSKLDIKAADYAFEGATEPAAGSARIKLTNTGKELHHMVIFTKNPGVTESFDVLLDLPEDQAEAKFRPVLGSDPIPPGESSYLTATFKPGEYVMVCFLSQGSTPDKADSPPKENSFGGGDGPPHFKLGMKKEFRVV